MKNRRDFLGAMTVFSGIALQLTAAGNGAAQADAAAPQPRPAKRPTPAALAIAGSYRAFDPKLSAQEIESIARSIDENRTGAVLNPRKKPLRNSDDMVVRFAAGERYGV